MSRNKPIAQREAPVDDCATPELFSDTADDEIQRLVSEILEEPGDGLSTDINDYGWDGGYLNGKRRLSDTEIKTYLEADLEPHSGLEQVLLSIIRRYEMPDERPAEKSKSKSHEQYRLEKALFFLTGARIPKGRPKGPLKEEDLRKIAMSYKKAVFDVDPADKFVEALIYRILADRYHETLTQKERSDTVRRAKDQFYGQFQRLMFMISRSSDEPLPQASLEIQRAIKAVEVLFDAKVLPNMDYKPSDN